MRLFFALWPDDDVTRQITEIAQQLNLESPSRRVDPKNYACNAREEGHASPCVASNVGGCLARDRLQFDSL
jgi:hypothetical protein